MVQTLNDCQPLLEIKQEMLSEMEEVTCDEVEVEFERGNNFMNRLLKVQTSHLNMLNKINMYIVHVYQINIDICIIHICCHQWNF